MRRIRIIPVLLLKGGGLYKTVRFKHANYIGDPVNTVKIFNEKEVDELLLLDFTASVEQRGPDFKTIADIAGEAFMPLGYGGGIKTLDDAKKVFDSGFEKIVLNSVLFDDSSIVEKIADVYGSQAVVACVDVKKNLFGQYKVWAYSGTKNKGASPLQWAKELEKRGAGEIILNSIDNDGTWEGYEVDVIKEIAHAIHIPVIACGGAGSHNDFQKAVDAGASAVAAGSLFLYQKKRMGILINFPSGLKLTS